MRSECEQFSSIPLRYLPQTYPYLDPLAFRTTLEPLSPLCEIAKLFLCVIHHSFRYDKVLKRLKPFLPTCCQRRRIPFALKRTYPLDFDFNCGHYSLFQSFSVHPILVASVKYGETCRWFRKRSDLTRCNKTLKQTSFQHGTR